jgi:hypothetical protein
LELLAAHTEFIVNESGKFVNAQLLLKLVKKLPPFDPLGTDDILDTSNDQLGKLINTQLALKSLKKLFHTEVILLVSKDQSGKLVSAQ